MPQSGFGIGMLVVRIDIPRTFFHQITESAFSQAVAKAARQIASELVNSDLKDKAGRLIGGVSFRRENERQQRCRRQTEKDCTNVVGSLHRFCNSPGF